MQPGNYQSAKPALSKIDKVIERMGPQIDAEMAEFRRLTHAGYRGYGMDEKDPRQNGVYVARLT